MSDLTRFCEWLRGYDGLPEGYCVDYADAVAEGGGVFPQGLEQVAVGEDILGRKTLLCRCHFVVYRTFHKGEGMAADKENAEWVLGLQRWVAAESAAGRAPRFGNVDKAAEQLWADKGKYHAGKASGVGMYSVELHAEFKMRMESE